MCVVMEKVWGVRSSSSMQSMMMWATLLEAWLRVGAWRGQLCGPLKVVEWLHLCANFLCRTAFSTLPIAGCRQQTISYNSMRNLLLNPRCY